MHEMVISASVDASGLVASKLVGEPHASFGIDIQSSRGAPAGECFGVDYGPDNSKSLSLSVALGLLGEFLPLLEGGWKDFRVLHDFENARIVVLAIPRDPSDPDRHAGHAEPPIASAPDIVGQSGGRAQ